MTIKSIISKHIKKVLNIIKIFITHEDLAIVRTSDKKVWDYQVNGIIKLANNLNKNPYVLSKYIISNMRYYEYKMYKKITASKLGFINIFINKTWLEKELTKKIKSFRLGIKKVTPKNIIIDYSSPNVAKKMHVGHLRSTILGDATARILEFLGHNVMRINHIGDWGTHFGMIIAYLKQNFISYNEINQLDLNELYQKAKVNFDLDSEFSKKTRNYVVKLQKKDKECIRIWKKIVKKTITENQKIYKKLNVTLTNKHIVGESFYNDMLPDIIQDLKTKKIAKQCNGAYIVFLNKFKNRDGAPMGVIIQKQDGAFLYSTIDLACLKYRCEVLRADQILYFIDSRQKEYLKQILEIAKKAGYISNNIIIRHNEFGMICSKNKRPFSTRSGNNIILSDLINEAIKRAKKIAKNKNKNLSNKELEYLSEKIGIGAIKYFDLSKNRLTDYIFKWDEILTFDGNTAPYMQYAYIRILSIFKKLNISMLKLSGNIILTELLENKLAIKLFQFEEIILESLQHSAPHIICKYLYELSKIFSKFYEKCSIYKSKNTKIRKNRLLLSLLTARTLKKGLFIIGISTIKYM
ncbi:arginyl-tRNA synthetase [Buchnera aphidicola str. Bp (Baizongia pistaciae)]|uniref:Arginine--tRNA ligase n=1 Tax=Buchnera aphidicola subsp. Baizongia pistaciae (strain Bp) TaxID=224915 RepID=SYR_BUCBP|nr:arginine--tRNA ligase [Buchnera aphidicola]P59483.1 RecName: Full=Arginine--tRNA ligase; AltName: Full=Arginyl-tRNA synthetase; Short=ArgRS [Buchnera aphidicola str. Bp (Baizongia pistaciae)]AAO26955.1 arginyl-tRNA synthetase [Buchnera aphidicola str. Bp (Baizongia pistaciae)]